MLLSALFLAVAVSFDSLAIGITYGLNKISIPIVSKLILSLVSGLSFFLAMLFGRLLEQQINPNFATILGGVLFILLGLYNLWRSYRPTQEGILIRLRLPFLGLIVQVLQEPLKADYDHSQHIAGNEAILLGFVLALDALTAGFGAAFLGLPLWITTLAVMLMCLLFLSQGLRIGHYWQDSPRSKLDFRWIPGCIILTIGFIKIFF